MVEIDYGFPCLGVEVLPHGLRAAVVTSELDREEK